MDTPQCCRKGGKMINQLLLIQLAERGQEFCPQGVFNGTLQIVGIPISYGIPVQYPLVLDDIILPEFAGKLKNALK